MIYIVLYHFIFFIIIILKYYLLFKLCSVVLSLQNINLWTINLYVMIHFLIWRGLTGNSFYFLYFIHSKWTFRIKIKLILWFIWRHTRRLFSTTRFYRSTIYIWDLNDTSSLFHWRCLRLDAIYIEQKLEIFFESYFHIF